MLESLCYFVVLVSNSPPTLKIERISGTAMTVSWNLLTLAEARGLVRNYTIFYFPTPSSKKIQQTSAMSETVDGTTDNIEISRLDENLAYSVQISAHTGAGTGAISMPVSVSWSSELQYFVQL